MEDNENNTPSFVLPEEYKEKGWASQMHSIDDLCKKIDNQERYISKGQLPHRDSSESDIEEFTKKMQKYTADLDYSDMTGKDEDLAKALKESGVPKFQAKRVVELIKSREAKEYGEEEFEKILGERFNGRQEDLAQAKSLLKELGSEKATKILNKRNNDVADVMEVLAEVGKKYAANTASAMAKLADGGNGSGGSADTYTKKKGICPEYLQELQEKYYDNPHADEDVKRNIMRKYGIID